MFRSTNVPFDQCSVRPMFRSTNVSFDQCAFDESALDESALDESVFDESTPIPFDIHDTELFEHVL